MPTTRVRVLALVFALATMDFGLAHGQSTRASVSRLQSASHAERRAALYSLLAAANPDAPRSYRDTMANFARFAARQTDVRRGVIALLEYENAHPAEHVDEDPYNGDLIAAVASLKDPSAVNALMGVITTGGLATRGLAALGDTAVPSLLRAAADSASVTRVSAVLALSRMATMTPNPTVSADNRGRIHAVLLDALRDPNRFVRESALDGLPAFHDTETRSAIAIVAKRDTFAIHDGGRVWYPVREAAAAALRKP